jgi:photosystem II stability/assembly factor-like uncharacterized protein
MRSGQTSARAGLQAALAFLLFTASSNGVPNTSDWVATRSGLAGKDLNAIFFADSKRGWIAGDDGFVSHTEDGGRTWVRQSVQATDSINDIYFRNKDDGYLLAGSRVFRTQDGGKSWLQIHRYRPDEFDGSQPELYSLRFAGKKKGWLVGSASKSDKVVDSLLFHTNDGGVTWRRQTVPTRSELIHLSFANDERGWIVGAQGTILHTMDAGETWTSQPSGTDATLYHVEFRDAHTGWVVGERGTILRTIDGGGNWLAVKGPVRSTLLGVQFVDDEEGWAVGRGGVILRTVDGGRTWVRQEVQTGQNLYALFINKKTGWAVGGDGLVFRYDR